MALPGVRSSLAAALLVIAGGTAFAQAPPVSEEQPPAGQAQAQSQAQTQTQGQTLPPAPVRRDVGTLRVTVVDETGAAIVDSPVRVANAAGFDRTLQTGPRGEAVFENLTPGKYNVHVESVGFDPIDLFDQNVRRGTTTRQVTLKIAAFVEQVDVMRDPTETALNDAFSTTLSQEQIAALPDDPDEMATVLEQMAGPGARIRVNGFSGGRLPPKSQIADIRFRFDPYSAENHDAGFPRVDIRTRPGQGDWRNSMTVTFRDDALNARNAFASQRGNEASQRGMWTIDGPIKKGKTSFSLALGGLNSYDTETIRSLRPGRTGNNTVEQPNDRLNVEARIEHALSKAHMLRLEVQRSGNRLQNLGVGDFTEEDRGYSQERNETTFRISESGSIKGHYRNEVRVEVSSLTNELSSRSDALAINVLDAWNVGGAQRWGGRRTRDLEIADDFDFTVGKKHALRTGIELQSSWLRADEWQNGTGTYTFSSIDDFNAGHARQFRQRVGNPLVEYSNTEFGWYMNDDIRLRKNVMVSAGVRYEAQSLLDDAVNFAPRLHVTWSPFKKARTVIRAGGGVFYDWYENNLYEDTIRLDGSPDRQHDIIIANPCYPDPTVCGDLSETPSSIVRESATLVMPRVARFSVGAEHQVTSWFGLRTNFYTQRGYNQFRALNANVPVNGVRPFPELGNISEYQTIGHTKNYGIEISGNFNYAPRRMFAFVHYRYGQAKNDGDGATRLPADSHNLAGEWGPSAGDVRHRLNFSINTPVALGFRVNTFVRYESASPYTITTGFDDNRDGVFYNDRPVGVGRNSARSSDAWTTDLRVSWSKGFGPPRTPTGPGSGPVRIGGGDGGGRGGGGGREGGGRGGPGGGGGGFIMMGGGPGEQKKFNVEVFTQINNLLNTVNFTGYSGVLTSAAFGQPIGAQPPRRIEIGTRFGF